VSVEIGGRGDGLAAWNGRGEMGRLNCRFVDLITEIGNGVLRCMGAFGSACLGGNGGLRLVTLERLILEGFGASVG